MRSKRVFLALGAVFALFVVWAVFFVLHLTNQPKDDSELDDFVAMRTKVRMTLLDHSKELPEGMTGQFSKRSAEQALFPPEPMIRASVANTGHSAQTANDNITIPLSKEQLAGPGLGLITRQLADHFSKGLDDNGPPRQRSYRRGPFTTMTMQIRSGLERRAAALDVAGGTATNEEVWSSSDGVMNVVLLVKVQQDPPRAKVSWYIIERF